MPVCTDPRQHRPIPHLQWMLVGTSDIGTRDFMSMPSPCKGCKASSKDRRHMPWSHEAGSSRLTMLALQYRRMAGDYDDSRLRHLPASLSPLSSEPEAPELSSSDSKLTSDISSDEASEALPCCLHRFIRFLQAERAPSHLQQPKTVTLQVRGIGKLPFTPYTVSGLTRTDQTDSS